MQTHFATCFCNGWMLPFPRLSSCCPISDPLVKELPVFCYCHQPQNGGHWQGQDQDTSMPDGHHISSLSQGPDWRFLSPPPQMTFVLRRTQSRRLLPIQQDMNNLQFCPWPGLYILCINMCSLINDLCDWCADAICSNLSHILPLFGLNFSLLFEFGLGCAMSSINSHIINIKSAVIRKDKYIELSRVKSI